MNDCCKSKELLNFDQTYSAWYTTARMLLPVIIKNRYVDLQEYDNIDFRDFDSIFSSKRWFNTPRGKATTLITKLPKANDSSLMVTTVHGSKGCTYDSTLVVSSKNEKSELGHWKAHWINGDGEAKRVGYVASTRAKYLLVWAVPILLPEDRKIIENYGFKNAEKILTTL